MTTATFVGDKDSEAQALQLAREHKQLKARQTLTSRAALAPSRAAKAQEAKG